MDKIEKIKTHLTQKRLFLETELTKVKQAEDVLFENPDEIIETLLMAIEKNPSNYGLLSYLVRKAVDSLEGSFNVRDIYREIKNLPDSESTNYSKTSIAQCLIRLKTENLIKEIEKGHGSIPSQYELTGANDD